MIGIVVGLVIGIMLTIFAILMKYKLTSKSSSTVKNQHATDEIHYALEEPVEQIEVVDAVDQVKLISNPAYTTTSNTGIQEGIYHIPTSTTLKQQELEPQNMRDDGVYLIPSSEMID